MLRRNFLKLTGLGAGALVALPMFGFATTSYEDAVAGIINKEIGYLKLDQKGLDKFIQDFAKDKNEKERLKVRSLYLLGVEPGKSDTIRGIVTAYLFSTDFFMNKMDETKPVNYIGLNTPYTRPCAHPFSFLYYPPTVS